MWDLQWLRQNPLVVYVPVGKYPELSSVGFPKNPKRMVQPGGPLIESTLYSSVRYGTGIGSVLLVVPFFIYRRRLPVLQRTRVKLINWALFYSGFATPISGCLGLTRQLLDVDKKYGTDVGGVVAETVALRKDKKRDQWNRTAAHGAIFGMVVTVAMCSSMTLMMRISSGLGLGVCGAAVFSATEMDFVGKQLLNSLRHNKSVK